MLIFGVVFFGAPYVPTRTKDVERIFGLVDLKNGRLVDLGAGDGRLLKAAAKRNFQASGWELSPIVWLIAWLRLRPYRKYAHMRFGNFWLVKLPDDTTVVFTFLVSRHMKRLDRYLTKEAKRLGHSIWLVSYGFSISGRVAEKQDKALFVYKFSP